MQYRGDPKNSTPPVEDVIAYNKIKANPLPSLAEGEVQSIAWKERILGSKGEVIVENHLEIRGGDPVLKTIEADLCDSFWYYPIISYTVSPKHDIKPVHHSEWYLARKARNLTTTINMRQINRRTYSTITH